MKKILFFTLLGCFQTFADQAFDLLQASDIGRGGISEGISWNAKVESVEDNEKSIREFKVKAKDTDAFVEATEPLRNKGDVYLFNDRNMWFYKPSLKKPVAISARQKLTGQAANGDIASTYYARDYTPSLIRTEQINGESTAVLLLKAKNKNVTYDQIRYWISEKRKLAVKADFLTSQGAAYKTAEFEYNNSITLQGKAIPFVSKMTIRDAKFSQNYSIIYYGAPKVEEIPSSLFKVNNLIR